MASSVHVPLTILLVDNGISGATPFLAICSPAPAWLGIGAVREAQMEPSPAHCTGPEEVREASRMKGFLDGNKKMRWDRDISGYILVDQGLLF